MITQTIMIDGYALPIRSNLYSALRHMRSAEVVMPLWIDAICINQNNIVERNEQVQRMANIYRGASQLLIWLGDATPTSSLAFKTFQALGGAVENMQPMARSSNIDVGSRECLRSIDMQKLRKPKDLPEKDIVALSKLFEDHGW